MRASSSRAMVTLTLGMTWLLTSHSLARVVPLGVGHTASASFFTCDSGAQRGLSPCCEQRSCAGGSPKMTGGGSQLTRPGLPHPGLRQLRQRLDQAEGLFLGKRNKRLGDDVAC